MNDKNKGTSLSFQDGYYRVESSKANHSETEIRARNERVGNEANRAVATHNKAKKAILPYVVGTLAALGIVAGAVFVGGDKPEDVKKMYELVPPVNTEEGVIRHRPNTEEAERENARFDAEEAYGDQIDEILNGESDQ